MEISCRITLFNGPETVFCPKFLDISDFDIGPSSNISKILAFSDSGAPRSGSSSSRVDSGCDSGYDSGWVKLDSSCDSVRVDSILPSGNGGSSL